ncbi:AAA family ATPase [Haliangium sp.]|uniref:AAA family ATPase n=1 Tax=Haliangium sp. TaxID=2663208 RepID=UPI003D0A4811
MTNATVKLRVQNFAQIRSAELSFGDLTVLVGPQGSGKSLLLQLFKLALDRGEIASTLRDAGHSVANAGEFLDLYFGQGMRYAWRHDTRVGLGRRLLRLGGVMRGIGNAQAAPGQVFYIPAHRAMLLAEGWPAPFLRLSADTPAVARLFSQNLFTLFGGQRATELFPVQRTLKQVYRDEIDRAVFHGGRVHLDKAGLRKRLELRFGDDTRLPFMTWTAGQREFTPILLGLYHLLPPRKLRKQEGIDWVVIEEPEMGLHPQAIAVVMLLVLDLLWRGYRVIISTHAPLVLDVVFTLQTLRDQGAPPSLLYRAFDIDVSPTLRPVFQAALSKCYHTYFLDFDDRGQVISKDISSLNPFSTEPDEAEWGGLTRFSGNVNRVLAEAVNG